MKAKLITLALFISIFTFPANALSELSITMANNTPFYIILNGEVIDPDGSSLMLYDVVPGNHNLQVYRYLTDNNGYYTKYVEIFYNGKLLINDMERLISHLTVDGRLMVTQRIDLRPNTGNNGYHGNGNQGNNGHYGNNGNSGTNGYHNGPNSNAVYIIGPAEFNRLEAMIRNASFEQTKLSVAKEGIRGKWVSSEMVYKIMKLFSFESTRLEFAKWAYHRTSNKQFFYTVHRAFHFESSIIELNQYIAMHG